MCQLDRIEVWDSKEKKNYLGDIEMGNYSHAYDIIEEGDRVGSTTMSSPEGDIEPPSTDTSTAYDVSQVDDNPKFNNLNEYIMRELEYPAYEKDAGIQGVVHVKFVVEVDGSLRNIKVVKKVTERMDNEALRIINTNS